MVLNCKAKGTRGERELIKFFNENGWSAIRAAGSGSSRYPSPDILAGNAIRRVAVECKVTKDQKKYLSPEDLEDLQIFAQRFGAEAWVGVRFPGVEWHFLMLEDLEKTDHGLVVSLELAKRRGLTAKELVGKRESNEEETSDREKF